MGALQNIRGHITWRGELALCSRCRGRVSLKHGLPLHLFPNRHPLDRTYYLTMSVRCSICLEDFNDRNTPLATVCGHLYCIDCATYNFANEGSACAVCRRQHTLDALIRLYPDYDSAGPSRSPAPKQRVLGEWGNDVLDASHTVLEGEVTHTTVAPVLHRRVWISPLIFAV